MNISYFRIVAALTNTTTSDNSGYDALQMLRQNIQPKVNNQSENKKEHEINNFNDEDEETENKSTVIRRQYHSDSEEDSSNEMEQKNPEPQNNEPGNSTGKESSDENKSQKRQTILLSATLTHAVEKLAGLTMHNPVFVDAAKENIENAGGNVLADLNEDLVVPQSVTQSYIVTPPKLRLVTLSAYIAGKCRVCNICLPQ